MSIKTFKNIKTTNELHQYLLFLRKKYENLDINDYKISHSLIPVKYLKEFLNIMIDKTKVYSDKYPNIPLCVSYKNTQFNLRDDVLKINCSFKDSHRSLSNFHNTYEEITQICKSKKISNKQFIKYSFYFKNRCSVEMRKEITLNEKKNCTAINSNTNIERDNEQIDHNNYKNLPNYQQNTWADGTRVIGYTIEETTKYGNDVGDFSDTEDSHDSDNDKKLSILAKQCVEQNRKRLISEETSKAKACNNNCDNQNKKIKTGHKNPIIEKTIPSQSITISYESSATDNAKQPEISATNKNVNEFDTQNPTRIISLKDYFNRRASQWSAQNP